MQIYVVKPGDTLYSIGRTLSLAPGFLARYNGLQEPYRLAVGQSLLALYPEKAVTVRAGDALSSIAASSGTDVLSLFRMNPNLSGSDRIYPGQVLVTQLEQNRTRSAFVAGYAYPYVQESVLRGILPFAGALLKKSEDAICPSSPVAEQKAKKIPAELEEFFRDVKWDLKPWRLDIHGERVYYMPENLPELKGARFLRSGLLLGELKKKRFEPSQAFAMCLKKDEYAQIIDLPCEDERVRRYLKGETLDVDDLTERKAKGWYLVCVDGFPLGWGKVSNGTLKNKYLPGWRLC